MGHDVKPFYILARDAMGVHIVLTVNGAANESAAWQRSVAKGIELIAIGDDYQYAAELARKLNAAHGIVSGGCSTCG